MKNFTGQFYNLKFGVKSVSLFFGILINLMECQASTESEEKSSSKIYKVLDEACENQIAPKVFIDYTLKEDKDKIIQEAGREWSKLTNSIEKLEDDSLNQTLAFLENYLQCLALANNQLLRQQEERLEELNSHQLSSEAQKPSSGSELETITVIEENKLSQNYWTNTVQNINVQRGIFWNRFQFFFKECLFTPFRTQYNPFKK